MSKAFAAYSKDKNTVLVMDSLNTAFRWKHMKAVSFLEDYISMVHSLARSYKASKIILLADYKGSYYRKSLYPEYKANRAALREKQTEEEALYFELFIKEYNNILDYFRENTDYPVLKFEGVEADDIAAYITQTVLDKKIWLMSTDKDWRQLVNENVSIFSYVSRKETRLDNFEEQNKCTLEQFISIKCLMGDVGDNVPGVVKVGPKTALKLVEQYGSALDIAYSLPLEGKYVYIKNLNEFGADRIMLNYKLMDLISFHKEAIGEQNLKEIDECLNKYLLN